MTVTSYDFGSPSETIPESENIYLQICREVDKWFLMAGPLPVIGIVTAYLLFVLKLGPDFMKDRKPLNIKPIITLYNLYQTVYNFYIVSKMFTTTGAVQYLWKHSCHPIDPAVNPLYKHINENHVMYPIEGGNDVQPNIPQYLLLFTATLGVDPQLWLCEVAWFFFFSKVMDLLDTVFFILRKKHTHITFLHVYHHSNMVLFSWFYLKYIKGEQGTIIGWINSLVHTIMYSYYFLSTLGPQVQKYLWWKRYITKLQMLQFVIIIVYMTSLLVAKCAVPKLLSVLLFIQGVTFLVLFTNFYVKSYILRDNKVDAAAKNVDNNANKTIKSQ